eukprot:6194940-Pleurochrysis_carterae.AAC.5
MLLTVVSAGRRRSGRSAARRGAAQQAGGHGGQRCGGNGATAGRCSRAVWIAAGSRTQFADLCCCWLSRKAVWSRAINSTQLADVFGSRVLGFAAECVCAII